MKPSELSATGVLRVIWLLTASALLPAGCATLDVRCDGKLEPINVVVPKSTAEVKPR
jgi:hypothetical protein